MAAGAGSGRPKLEIVADRLLLVEGRDEANLSCPMRSYRDKTFAHAYLAATDDPVARVGEGALQGAWDFDSDAFADLSAFLRELLSA